MGYLIMFIAWLKMQSSNLTDHAWSFEFWTKVLDMTRGVYDATWTIWWIVVGIGVVVSIIALLRGASFKDLFGCLGCLGVILLILPFGAWINLKEAEGIINSISPTTGIVNSTNFWVSLALYLLFGLF